MAVTEAQVAGTELEKVIPKLQTAFDYDKKFFSQVMKRPAEKISNRQMRVPMELRPGGDFGYFDPDGGDLGRGGGPTFDKATLNCVFVKEGIEYTKLADWATDDNRKAIINSVRKLTARAYDEIKRQLDGQCMQAGNGAIGTIGTVATSGGVDTYTLDTDGFGARLMRYGQTIQVFDATLATLRGSGKISFWDVENKQIQVPAIAGAIATDRIVTQGITSPNSLPGLYGVPYQHSNASTGTFLGYSRASTPEIRSNRVSGASSALALPLPRLALNKIGNRIGIDENFNAKAWMHPCQKQAYEDIGQTVSIIQKQAKEEGLDMYFDKMQMAGAPVETSFNWDMTRIDFIVEALWGRAEILPLGFYMVDGRKIFEIRGASGGVATSDIFYMVLGTQLFVSNPAGTAYIDTLAVPTGY